MGDILISTSEAAKLLNVSSRTVINYCEREKLKYAKNKITKRYGVSLASVKRLLRRKTKNEKAGRQRQ